MMDEARLNETRARLAAATRQPWRAQEGHVWSDQSSQLGGRYCDDPVATCYGTSWEANATLIAHAPQDLQDLLEEVQRLRGAFAAGALQIAADHCRRRQWSGEEFGLSQPLTDYQRGFSDGCKELAEDLDALADDLCHMADGVKQQQPEEE